MLIKLLTKLQYWRNGTIQFGFYYQSSIFRPAIQVMRKLELRFALGNRDYHIKYL